MEQGYESEILKEIHKYKCLDVGIDTYFEKYGNYSLYSFEILKELMENKFIIDRH